jgi:Tetratricopeptide repeat
MEVMSVRGISAAVGLAMTLAVGAWGQDTKQDPPPPCLNATAKNCVPPKTAPAKNAADQNPFPGETSTVPTRPPDWGPDQALPPDPNAPPPAPAQAQKPGEPQPFPGEPAAPAGTQKPGEPQAFPGEPAAPKDDGFSSSSSSSSSSGSPDDASGDSGGLADKGSSGDTTAKVPISKRKKLPKVSPETPESRASEDLTVADFYQNDGNFKGAYDRAKDAVQYQPNDPYGHFALAEAARKLGKLDEAKTEYQAVLKLDPIPKQEKASKRALAEMEGK